MLFDFIIQGFFNIFDYFINLFPAVNSGISWDSTAFATFTDVIFDNIGLIDIFIPLNMFFTMFGAIITIFLVKWTFDLVMFILRKVPVASLD